MPINGKRVDSVMAHREAGGPAASTDDAAGERHPGVQRCFLTRAGSGGADTGIGAQDGLPGPAPVPRAQEHPAALSRLLKYFLCELEVKKHRF